jgi:hypothetical protein
MPEESPLISNGIYSSQLIGRNYGIHSLRCPSGRRICQNKLAKLNKEKKA